MKVLELFSGYSSVGNAFKERGHEVITVDWNEKFNPDICCDIGTLTPKMIEEKFEGFPDVVWMSFECTTYSVSAISKHRRKNKETGELEPISEYAEFCDKVNQHALELCKELNPTFWFIENPRGGLRKMSWMQDLPRYTVTYCQYGFKYQKPTDIWTNHPDPQFKPPCKRGMPCHEPAPRGAKTGLQRYKDPARKAIIPAELCQHIVDICEEYIN